MKFADTFVREYSGAGNSDIASIALVDALGRLVLRLKSEGFSAERVLAIVKGAITDGGGHTVRSKHLDEELLAHCIEEYYRPSEARPLFFAARESLQPEIR